LVSPDDDAIREDSAATTPADPSRAPVRAGGLALSLLATPLNIQILEALSEHPLRLAELRKAAGLPAQTTLRGHLANLADLGVLRKRPTQRMPYAVENELTPMGRGLLEVAERLQLWLSQAPDGPISLSGGAAKGAVRALIDGWGSRMMRALAAHPRSLTELDGLIPDLSYPSLERRLSSMRLAGLVEAQPSVGTGTPYTVTRWARQGVAPIAAASHCESVHLNGRGTPVTQTDIEAAFLLATPLVGLPKPLAGLCQLEVELAPEYASQPAGVQVMFERGSVVSCVPRLESNPSAYAAGPAFDWVSALREGKIGDLRFGGSREIAEDVVAGLHATYVHG
jgi:DNA-binding HxlR family transcriptional regulator